MGMPLDDLTSSVSPIAAIAERLVADGRYTESSACTSMLHCLIGRFWEHTSIPRRPSAGVRFKLACHLELDSLSGRQLPGPWSCHNRSIEPSQKSGACLAVPSTELCPLPALSTPGANILSSVSWMHETSRGMKQAKGAHLARPNLRVDGDAALKPERLFHLFYFEVSAWQERLGCRAARIEHLPKQLAAPTSAWPIPVLRPVELNY